VPEWLSPAYVVIAAGGPAVAVAVSNTEWPPDRATSVFVPTAPSTREPAESAVRTCCVRTAGDRAVPP
jgi:hypothetical protein